MGSRRASYDPVLSSRYKDRITEREKLFGIPKSQPNYTGGRSYNYAQKYPPDEIGQEASDEARVWMVYLDEAESYDEDMVRGFRDTIDSLLVLAGLFSAVVAAFVVQTSTALQPDYTQLTAALLAEQIALLRANSEGLLPNNVPEPVIGSGPLAFSGFDVWVNGLFFTSLTLAMITALLAVLVKQWLQAYTSLISGSAKERALARQFRFDGLRKWKLEAIVGFLPLLLHLAFAVFLVGLCVFVYDLYAPLTWIVAGLTALMFIAYSSAIMPAIWLDCPYRIPLLFRITQVRMWLFEQVFFELKRIISRITRKKTRVFRPSLRLPSLKEAERAALKPPASEESYIWGLRDDVLCASLTWLWKLSGNRSTHEITAQALHGLLVFKHRKEYSSHPYEQSEEVEQPYTHEFSSLWSRLPLLPMFDEAWKGFVDCATSDDNSGATLIWTRLFTILQSQHTRTIFSAGPWTLQMAPVLVTATRRGCTRFLTAAVHGGADVHTTDAVNDETILQVASKEGHVEIVDLLLQHNADIKGGVDNQNALLTALNNGDLLVLQAFAKHRRVGASTLLTTIRKMQFEIFTILLPGLNCDISDEILDAALNNAALDKGQLPFVRQLVEHNVDLSQGGALALFLASRDGDLPLVENILRKGINPNTMAPNVPTSALHVACIHGHLNVVKALRANDSSPNNSRSPKYTWPEGAHTRPEHSGYGSPLHAVCARGNVKLARELLFEEYPLANNPNPNLLTPAGPDGCRTPLMTTIHHHHHHPERAIEVIRLLLSHEDIKPALLAPGNSNGSALHLAAARGFFEAVTLLIGSGAYPDLNLQAGEYDTALQAACDFSPPSNSEMMPADHFKVIHHLLQHGADPNSTIQNFPRALFCAARRNNLKAAKLLLECGADVNATNDLPGHSFGTAIHVAFRSGFSEMARLLLTNGAYLHKNPFYSATPMNSVITRSKSMPDLGRLMSRGEGRSRRASLI